MVQRNKARPRKEWQSGNKLRCRANGINAMNVARALSRSLVFLFTLRPVGGSPSCTQRSSLALSLT